MPDAEITNVAQDRQTEQDEESDHDVLMVSAKKKRAVGPARPRRGHVEDSHMENMWGAGEGKTGSKRPAPSSGDDVDNGFEDMTDGELSIINVPKRPRRNAQNDREVEDVSNAGGNEIMQDSRRRESGGSLQDADEGGDDAIPVIPRRSPRNQTSTIAGSIAINAGSRPGTIRPPEPTKAATERHRQRDKRRAEQAIRESEERASGPAARQRASPRRKSAVTAKASTSQKRVQTGSITLSKSNKLGNLKIVAPPNNAAKRAITDAADTDNDGIQRLKSTRLPLSVQVAVADESIDKLNLILQRKSPGWCERRLQTLAELGFFESDKGMLGYDDLKKFVKSRKERKWCNAQCNNRWSEVDGGVGWRCGNMKCEWR